MLLINQITANANQQQVLILPDGTSMTLVLYFSSMQFGWFIKSLTYGSFTLTGLRISNNFNMLRQWKNILPFGMACISDGQREPTLIQDFFSGASKLYILTAAEVQEYEGFLTSG